MDEDIYGIDLGTTYSAASVVRPGEISDVRLENDSNSLPSVVWLAESDGVLTARVGLDAWLELSSDCHSDAGKVFLETKRFMGQDISTCGGAAQWHYAGHTFDSRDIAALILKKIRQRIVSNRGGRDGRVRAIVSHPAYFLIPQKEATKQAAEWAGIDVLDTITEPGAAIFAYSPPNDAARFLVFDLGGGTLDVSVVETDSKGTITIRRHKGLPRTGGLDWDRLILGLLKRRFSIDYPGIDFDSNVSPDVQTLLLRKCCGIKQHLSGNPYYRGKVDLRVGDSASGEKPRVFPVRLEVTQEQFEKEAATLLFDCRGCVEDVLRCCSLKPADINRVLLVGGSTRMPMIQKMLSELFDRSVRLSSAIDPDHAVARGAAHAAYDRVHRPNRDRPLERVEWVASEGAADIKRSVPTDCLARSLRVEEDKDGRPICGLAVEAGHPTPFEKTIEYLTIRDNQSSIRVNVYEGDVDCVEACSRVGTVLIEGLPKRPKGMPVNVCLKITESGRLEVAVTDKNTGKIAHSELVVNNATVGDSERRKAFLDRIQVE